MYIHVIDNGSSINSSISVNAISLCMQPGRAGRHYSSDATGLILIWGFGSIFTNYKLRRTLDVDCLFNVLPEVSEG